MTKPNLLILTPGFPINEADSTSVPYIQDWILAAKTTFHIKVISFQYPFEEKNYLWNEVEIYSAGGKNKPFPFRLLTWWKVWKQMNRWHNDSPFDIVLCFWLTEPSLLGEYFFRKNPHIKLVRWALGQDVKPDNNYLKLLDLKKGKMLFLSERYIQIMYDNANVLLLGLPNFVSQIPLPPQREIDIIGIGSHIPLKRYDVFLKTVALLKQDNPSIQCVLIGHGKETLYLKELAKNLDLLNHVQFIPYLSREQIFEMLAKSKILFHTSEYEGQGMVLTEALQMGCYVVVGDVGNVPQNPKAFICPKDEQFFPTLTSILKQEKPDFSPIQMLTMQACVAKFKEYVL